jgi:hypothetical protein
VTAQGSAYTRLKRALARGNAMLAWSAAAELPRVELVDALSLCLLLADTDRARYERAIVRWHGRLCVERRSLTLPEAQMALAALHGIGRPGERAAIAALSEILDGAGLEAGVDALGRWAASRV